MKAMGKEFGDLPGDKTIEVSLDHRTLIIIRNPGCPTVVEICIPGWPGTRDDITNIDIAPGKGNKIDILYNQPKEVLFLQSLPAAELKKRNEEKREQLSRSPEKG
jgi:hypothetical protein